MRFPIWKMYLSTCNETLSLLRQAYLSPYLPDSQVIILVYCILFHSRVYIKRLIWTIPSFIGSGKSL